MNLKKRLTTALLSAAFVLSLVACGSPAAQESPSTVPSPSTEPASADHTIGGMIVLAGARTLTPGLEDVYFSHELLGAWGPLISADEGGDPMGVLAESWECNEDATIWTFHLRQGVRFQNGEGFSTDIVVENFDRYKLMESGYSQYTTFKVDKLYPGLIGCEKIGDYTVNVSLTGPVPRLLFNMKDTASCIFYPGSWNAETGYFTEQPVSTGPYIIKDTKEDEYVDVTAFDGYWGEPAETRNTRARIITDSQTRYAALDSEGVMGVLDLEAMPAALGNELLRDDRFATAVQTSSITHIVLLKGGDTKFSDIRLRQAIDLAIGRQLIVDQLWGGYTMSAQNLINRMCLGWVELSVEYDIDRAKEPACEVLGGERLPLDMYTHSLYLNRGPYKEIMEYIQSQLSQIGIDTTVNVIDSPAYSEMSKAGELRANFMTHSIFSLNAYHLLDIYMSSERSYNKSQHLAYSNPHMDELLTEMRTTLDDGHSHELATELQEITNTELPAIPLFYDTSNLIYDQEQIAGCEGFSGHLDLSRLSWVNAQ